MNDYVYIYNKQTFAKSLLGEIQNGFNQSFVIDGTKDTCKVNVYSMTLQEEIEPWTILLHENTNTWWIISHDKVERHLSENGYLYTHELSLEGAIELLNARDLTDCGFNQNKYTIIGFIQRLFELARFEYTLEFTTETFSAIAMTKMVDYVKTYQNYTLLSALRDFLSGYNCEAKLQFTENNDHTAIAKCKLDIVSKTGNSNALVNDYEYFNDVKEVKTMTKNSFGTVVISNAENVISTKDKTFPLVGAVKVSSNAFVNNTSNAVLRLPSKAFKVNRLDIITDLYIQLVVPEMGSSDHYTMYLYDTTDSATIQSVFDKFEDLIDTYCPAQKTTLMGYLEDKRQDIIDTIRGNATIEIYDGNKIDPTYNNGEGRLLKGDNVPKIAYANDGFGDIVPLTLIEDSEKNQLPKALGGLVWKRGSNIITHFDFITGHSYVTGLYRKVYGGWYYGGLRVNVIWGESSSPANNDGKIWWGKFSCRCNYIPMSDIKVKIDNQKNGKDIQLYNQNGKLTGSNALSKLLNSYSKEISSNTITKYYTTYNLSSIKSVGQRFKIGNDIYVANNLSIDYVPNENGYYIECEYTLSKQFAVKSLMVNPNTNIRDYGIPQNYNVERKQTYRDYYELTYQKDNNADNDPYCDYKETLLFKLEPKDQCSYIGVIKCYYEEPIGSSGNTSSHWYYQLETTKYELDKMFCMVINFNDNNIIGYSSQNVYSGFNITRVFTNWIDNVNTPISYVDDNGEVYGISISFVDSEQICEIYDNYKAESGYSSEDRSLYNFSCFVPQDIYDSAESVAKLKINEIYYKKDALEVPVFEYVCQIGDSEDVLVGDNILNQDTSGDYIYLYQYEEADSYTTTAINSIPTDLPTFDENTQTVTCNNGCLISFSETDGIRMHIDAFYYRTYNVSLGGTTTGGSKELNKEKDFILFRHKINKTTGELVSTDLLLIAQNVPESSINYGELILFVNHYKLK